MWTNFNWVIKSTQYLILFRGETNILPLGQSGVNEDVTNGNLPNTPEINNVFEDEVDEEVIVPPEATGITKASESHICKPRYMDKLIKYMQE